MIQIKNVYFIRTYEGRMTMCTKMESKSEEAVSRTVCKYVRTYVDFSVSQYVCTDSVLIWIF